METPKMNEMMKIAMQSKAFRMKYQNKPQDKNKVTATFVKNKEEDNVSDEEITQFMEWFSNQRFPEEK